MNVQHCVELIP